MINIPNTKINSSNPYLQLLNQNPIVNSVLPPTIDSINIVDNNNSLMLEIHQNVIKLLDKKVKHKKNTYLNITNSMFNQDILLTYPDFPIEKMNMIFSDGETYFIQIGNKKYPLNKKNFLKFINYILK